MEISFKDLFEYCEKQNFKKIVTDTGNEVFQVSGIKILRFYNVYQNVKAVSRHYVTKDRYRINVRSSEDDQMFVVETTNDHTCIKYEENYFVNVKASKLRYSDNVPIYQNNRDIRGIVISVENLGPWNDYVYDLEVEGTSHTYYANNILVHNSQFIDISPMVEYHLKQNNLPTDGDFSSFNEEQLDHLINELDDFVEKDINVYVKDLINKECHTTEGHNLHYSREYVASQAMFFKKKNYICHIIKNDDKNVDKFKYCGVSCKKTEIPADMKYFLKTIFEDTCNKRWKEKDYKQYIDNVFDQFLTKDYQDISLYKSYNTEKVPTSFMQSEKGTGAHARAANIYNQLLNDLKIADKYEKINLGDQLRYCYVNDTNPYGINVVGFKEYIPEEFKKIFTINYNLMFEKIFLSSLKGYNIVMKFNSYSPSNKSMFDVNDL